MVDPGDVERFWGKEFLPDVELIDRTLRRLDIEPDSSVLDVGTGWGIMATQLAVRGFAVVTGQPLAEEPHGHGEAVMDDRNLESSAPGSWRRAPTQLGVIDRIQFEVLRAEELPFPSDVFHGVFLYDALQHVQDRERVLRECLRVVRPGGVVCVIETNAQGAAHYRSAEGFEIEPLDPRDYLSPTNVTVELCLGEHSSAFLIRPP